MKWDGWGMKGRGGLRLNQNIVEEPKTVEDEPMDRLAGTKG
jgi:hypothetical protein